MARQLTFKLAFSAAALCLLGLLPFLAHLAWGPSELTRPVSGAGDIAPLIASGQFRQARLLLESTERDGLPRSEKVRLLYQQAICDRMLDDPAQAYERLARLQHTLPVLSDYRTFWMAVALADMGELGAAKEALEDFVLASQHQSLTDSAYFRLVGLYAEQGGYDRAVLTGQRLLRRLRHEHEAADTHYLLAGIYQVKGDLALAERSLRLVVNDHPRHVLSLEALDRLPPPRQADEILAAAQVQRLHGKHARSAASFEKFLLSFPRHELAGVAQFKLGNSYLKASRYTKARRAFSRAYEKHGLIEGLYRVGGVLVRTNQENEAIGAYSELARLHPASEWADDALWQAAKSAERRNQFALAEGFYHRLAQNYAESDYADEARWSVGFSRYCREQYREAMDLFLVSSQQAREPHIVDQSLFWAGKTAERLGMREKSVEYFQRAAEGFPRSYYSARALNRGYGHGLPPQLNAGNRSVLAADRFSLAIGEAFLRRAAALAGLGLRNQARNEMRRVEQLNGEDVEALREVRVQYLALGFPDRAFRLSNRIYALAEAEQEFAHLYPDYYWEQVQHQSEVVGIDPHLVLSVIRQESSFQKDAVSRAGAIGLMQIMPQTGKVLARKVGLRRFRRSSLFDPQVSIRLGSRYLAEQVRRFSQGPTTELGYELGLAAYNAGPHIARAWTKRFDFEDPDAFVERIPYKETRLYVKLVLKNYTIYKALSGISIG